MIYAVYMIESGEIVGVVSMGDEAPQVGDFGPRRAAVPAPDASPSDIPSGYYVADGRAVPRPRMGCVVSKTTILANGTDSLSISSVPAGAAVSIMDANGQHQYKVDDGILEITSDVVGSFRITIEAFPAAPFQVTGQAVQP